jgi:hypothetical protein
MLAVLVELLEEIAERCRETEKSNWRGKDWMRSTLFVKMVVMRRMRFDQGNKEIAKKKRKEIEVMSWLMMCLMLLLRSKDSCLIYQVTLNNTFSQSRLSLKVGVTILARRQSGLLLFQRILSSRWWYQ